MSGAGAAQKKTSLHELLDQFADAQCLDIKAHSSGHLNESKLYCLPDPVPHFFLAGHNRSPVKLQTLSGTGISAKSQTKVKKDALTEVTRDAQMKHCHKLKPLISNKCPKFTETVDSKPMTRSIVSSQWLSSSEPQEGACQVSLDGHGLVEELCLASQMDSEQRNAKSFHSACSTDLQQPATGIFVPSVVPTHLKTATKKDQFRKMRDYHKNVIQHPTRAHQHALTGSDAVKYLEHHLQQV